jgi:hypothetical protein
MGQVLWDQDRGLGKSLAWTKVPPAPNSHDPLVPVPLQFFVFFFFGSGA